MRTSGRPTCIQQAREPACGLCGLGCEVDKPEVMHAKMVDVITQMQHTVAPCSFAQLEGGQMASCPLLQNSSFRRGIRTICKLAPRAAAVVHGFSACEPGGALWSVASN